MSCIRFRTNPVPSKRAYSAALDNFAELLSMDIPLPEIADRMDITQGSACAYLRTLRERYGEA